MPKLKRRKNNASPKEKYFKPGTYKIQKLAEVTAKDLVG